MCGTINSFGFIIETFQVLTCVHKEQEQKHVLEEMFTLRASKPPNIIDSWNRQTGILIINITGDNYYCLALHFFPFSQSLVLVPQNLSLSSPITFYLLCQIRQCLTISYLKPPLLYCKNPYLHLGMNNILLILVYCHPRLLS